MKLQFPKGFIWGTSTAAAQVETAFEHQWKGVKATDGYTFDNTTEHEKRRDEDISYIKQFGSMYRCGVDWSKLQRGAFQEFDESTVLEYQDFFQKLRKEGMQIMFVLHHFSNPLWFENNGSWLNEDNIPAYLDYCKKCIKHFGEYVANWNTFNEPNVYAANSFITGLFPPFQKNYFKGDKALKHMAMAHDIAYDFLKAYDPTKPIGISQNTVLFEGRNLLGKLPAKLADWWFNKKTAELFKKSDYCGLSYYALMPFDPFPITELETPEKIAKLGMPHDKMWCYYPEGFLTIMRRNYKKYKKPIIITENGICTDDPERRIQSIKDYLKICHQAIEEGIELQGYIHWSTWDNFEWNIGPTYRFGLVTVDFETMDRTMTSAGKYYSKVTKENAIDI